MLKAGNAAQDAGHCKRCQKVRLCDDCMQVEGDIADPDEQDIPKTGRGVV